MVTMTLRPAPVGHGIVFVRMDLDGDNVIPALYDRVTDTRMCTLIANDAGASVGTIEHLMSALRGCGVDNLLIELDGPEVPIMDGSSIPFVEMIDETGLRAQAAPRRVIRILRDIEVRDGDKLARLSPADAFIFGGEIDFVHPAIGRQMFETKLVNGNFRHDIASARTFGFVKEVEFLRQNGLARGGSLDNAVVLDDHAVMNVGGLRFDDEFIRHKLLDAIGDLYLAGAAILGRYDSMRAGHAINNALLHALFASPDAWEWVEVADPAEAASGATAQAAELVLA
jgi:UDP-3-O-[3-hydroxymyristoyl] N-acetylglucosamine deacetylase